jgi:phenylpropionate dioxygenase-like ring-hydroxylating dioxygenase large terminal subunit
MNQSLQEALVRRVLAHLDARTTDRDAAASQLPVAVYLDDSPAAFRQRPVAIAHASQLAEPGAFVTHDLSGVPLLVARGDDHVIRAFKNVCRHRGTRVEQASCGIAKAFVCPYHAWSYARDGRLLGVPHPDGFGELPAGLAEVPVAVIAGLVFVQLDGGRIDAAYLGPIANDLASFGLARGHVHDARLVTRELSWKLAIDIFLEAYHLRPTHKDSIYRLFFDNVALVDRVGPHLRNVFPKRTIRELAQQPPSQWELRRHANVLFHVFPNTLILVEPDHAAVLHLWPAGAGRVQLQSYTIVPEPPLTDKARAYWAANNAILYGAIDEDFAMGESIQRGLASGANTHVTFAAFEHALAHFHAQLALI